MGEPAGFAIRVDCAAPASALPAWRTTRATLVDGPATRSHGPCGMLVRPREGVVIDGRGWVFGNIVVERLWRNVKHEDVYLN